MTIYTTAAEAIARSFEDDGITFCADTEQNRKYLRSQCDDHVDTGEVIEYWANDEEEGVGMEWRVHIRTAPAY